MVLLTHTKPSKKKIKKNNKYNLNDNFVQFLNLYVVRAGNFHSVSQQYLVLGIRGRQNNKQTNGSAL